MSTTATALACVLFDNQTELGQKVLEMVYSFTRSRVVIYQLAQATARNPLPNEDPPFEDLDRNLTILGRTFDIQ